jgi:hypothetical protein
MSLTTYEDGVKATEVLCTLEGKTPTSVGVKSIHGVFDVIEPVQVYVGFSAFSIYVSSIPKVEEVYLSYISSMSRYLFM